MVGPRVLAFATNAHVGVAAVLHGFAHSALPLAFAFENRVQVAGERIDHVHEGTDNVFHFVDVDGKEDVRWL